SQLAQFGLERHRYVLAVGRLVPEKRHGDLIKAFVDAAPPGWKLCITLALLTVFKMNRFVLAIGGFFWFVTPVWGPINEFLQWSSIWMVTLLMNQTGIPTFVYQEYVEIPAGTFQIADGCSGLRYVIAALALVVFYGVLHFERVRSLAILAAFALFGAMITNWLRIVALILIGYFSDMQAPIIKDHNMFGWFLFAPLMFITFYFADRLEPTPNTEKVDPDTASLAGLGVPVAIVISIIIIISGITIRLITGTEVLRIETLDIDAAPAIEFPTAHAPQIYASSIVNASEETTPTGEATYDYIIDFDGSTDAQRAEFYLNEYVPVGWSITDQKIGEHETILLVKRGKELATVTYSIEIGGDQIVKPKDIRQARLRAAMALDRTSRLNWRFTTCSKGCAIAMKDEH
ncbi:MAG: exosortase, partial [Pseudomonadota bacterium]